jgi:hypothetical protein
MFTWREKPIRIIGNPDNQLPDKWISTVFVSKVFSMCTANQGPCLDWLHTSQFFIPTCLWRWNRQCSETSAYKIQTPGNYPEKSIQELSLLPVDVLLSLSVSHINLGRFYRFLRLSNVKYRLVANNIMVGREVAKIVEELQKIKF